MKKCLCFFKLFVLSFFMLLLVFSYSFFSGWSLFIYELYFPFYLYWIIGFLCVSCLFISVRVIPYPTFLSLITKLCFDDIRKEKSPCMSLIRDFWLCMFHMVTCNRCFVYSSCRFLSVSFLSSFPSFSFLILCSFLMLQDSRKDWVSNII